MKPIVLFKSLVRGDKEAILLIVQLTIYYNCNVLFTRSVCECVKYVYVHLILTYYTPEVLVLHHIFSYH